MLNVIKCLTIKLTEEWAFLYKLQKMAVIELLALLGDKGCQSCYVPM